MFDRRVIRGNTYASAPAERALPARSLPRAPRRRPPGTPEPVEGRRHMDIQTEAFLEELADTVPEAEVMTQTDAFMDRPPTPLFIPMKIGVDVETQIENGDLFDFDFEVEPILEVLVGKTLEQGLMEVMEEEELAAMRAHQEHFEQIRNAELVATQRMEAAERRKAEERERRIAQEKQRIAREKATREKVAAQTFARGYTSGLLGSVFDRLYDSGFFYDPVQREIETDFIPWFEDQVVAECSEAAASRKCVDEIIKKAFMDAAAAQAAGAESLRRELDEEKERVASAAAAAAAATAAAQEQIAIAQTVLDIFMKVSDAEVVEGEVAPEAVVSGEQYEEAKRALKEVAATTEKEQAEGLEDEEAKIAYALRLITLLLAPPVAEGEEPAEPALTQEQVDEAKKALAPEPEPEPEAPAEGEGEAAPAEGEGEAAPAEGEGEAAPVEGEGEAAPAEAKGDAATEPVPEPEPEPPFEPASDALLKHLIEAGTVTDTQIVAALAFATPEPPADAILNQLLESEIVVETQVAKALVAKQLEDEESAESGEGEDAEGEAEAA